MSRSPFDARPCVQVANGSAQDEISIVQASLLGSILANLLLILGMSFLLGGLRFREQVWILPSSLLEDSS